MLLRKSQGRENIFTVFIEKNLHVSGPMGFQPMLFKGQLYFHGMLTEVKPK